MILPLAHHCGRMVQPRPEQITSPCWLKKTLSCTTNSRSRLMNLSSARACERDDVARPRRNIVAPGLPGIDGARAAHPVIGRRAGKHQEDVDRRRRDQPADNAWSWRRPHRNKSDDPRRPTCSTVRSPRASACREWSCAARRGRCRPRLSADWRLSRNRSRRLRPRAMASSCLVIFRDFTTLLPQWLSLSNAGRRLAKFVIWYNQFIVPCDQSSCRETEMSKLKLPNLDDVVAIDIHTHAEEPCGMHGDDGYDDFQAQMAEYFKSPNKHPPTVAGNRGLLSRQENRRGDLPGRRRARDRIPPLQQLRDAGDRRRKFRRADPLRQHRSAQGQARGARGAQADRGIRRQGLQIPSDHAGLLSQRPHGLSAVRGDQRRRRDRAVPHRADRRRLRHARRHGDAAEIFQSDVHGRRGGGFSRFEDHPRASRPSPGRKRRCRSRPTSRTSTSTSPAGRRNISRRSWCATSTRSCRTRCCSARTGR